MSLNKSKRLATFYTYDNIWTIATNPGKTSEELPVLLMDTENYGWGARSIEDAVWYLQLLYETGDNVGYRAA